MDTCNVEGGKVQLVYLEENLNLRERMTVKKNLIKTKEKQEFEKEWIIYSLNKKEERKILKRKEKGV